MDNAEFYKKLGHILKTTRTNKGLDVADVSDRTGMPNRYIHYMENGGVTTSVKDLVDYCTAIGMPTSDIIIQLSV